MKKKALLVLVAGMVSMAHPVVAQSQSPLIGNWLDKEEGMIIKISWCDNNAKTLCALVLSEKISDGDLSLVGQTIVRDITAVANASGNPKLWRGRLTAEGLPKAKVEMRLRTLDHMEATYCAGWFCDTSRYVRQ